MAFRDRVDAGRQVRHTFDHLRDREVVALVEPGGRHGRRSRVPAAGGGDWSGRTGPPSRSPHRSGTRGQVELRRVSAARQGFVQLARLAALPRGPPWVPSLGPPLPSPTIGRVIAANTAPCPAPYQRGDVDGASGHLDRRLKVFTDPSDACSHRLVRLSTHAGNRSAATGSAPPAMSGSTGNRPNPGRNDGLLRTT